MYRSLLLDRWFLQPASIVVTTYCASSNASLLQLGLLTNKTTKQYSQLRFSLKESLILGPLFGICSVTHYMCCYEEGFSNLNQKRYRMAQLPSAKNNSTVFTWQLNRKTGPLGLWISLTALGQDEPLQNMVLPILHNEDNLGTFVLMKKKWDVPVK